MSLPRADVVRIVPAGENRGALISVLVLLAAIATLGYATVAGSLVTVVAPVVLILSLLLLTYRKLLEWHVLLGQLTLVIFVIPIHRYAMPGNLPFELEPYRLVVLLIAAGWIATLFVDRRISVCATGLEAPLAAVLITVVVSIAANLHRVSAGLTSEVLKKISYLISFIIVLYIVPSVLRRMRQADALIKTLVWGASAIAIMTLYEGRTHHNVFSDLGHVLPFLVFKGVAFSLIHDSRNRPFASAESPIALGAMFVIVLPLAVYLARKTGERRWWIGVCLLVLGASASRSRTAILMLVIEAFVLLALRPREVKRFWPAIVPLALAVHIASPGSFGVIRDSFVPKGGLIAQQANAPVGSGRVSSMSPALKQWQQAPLVGIGYGTRITDLGPQQNAYILDDQWLGTLLETGIAGALAWVWVFVRSIRRLAAAARRDQSAQGWLPAGVAAAVTAFGISMFTYDAFSFAQETFLLLILLGIAAIPSVGGLVAEPVRQAKPKLRRNDTVPSRLATENATQ